jgi:MaoC like domain
MMDGQNNGSARVTYHGDDEPHEWNPQRGQQVSYVTERAVFELENGSVTLTEIAPGVRLEEDTLAHMGFKPRISPPAKRIWTRASSAPGRWGSHRASRRGRARSPLINLHYEDIALGAEFETATHTVTEADIASFADVTRDHHPLHVDPLCQVAWLSGRDRPWPVRPVADGRTEVRAEALRGDLPRLAGLG